MKAVRSSSHVSIVPSLSSSTQVSASLEFMNVFMWIGFDSTIELVSFDKSQVVTFNGKFVCGIRNGYCETGSRSDNSVGSPHGFVIHGIKVLKGNEKVTKVIDVENWRQLSIVEVDCLFVRMELSCFIDEVFDSEYVQVQVKVITSNLWSCDVELGLVTFHPNLNVFYPLLENNSSDEESFFEDILLLISSSYHNLLQTPISKLLVNGNFDDTEDLHSRIYTVT
ncbi:hypothetical protein Tco_1236899 [Tanacetum coccineum]